MDFRNTPLKIFENNLKHFLIPSITKKPTRLRREISCGYTVILQKPIIDSFTVILIKKESYFSLPQLKDRNSIRNSQFLR